MTWIKKQRVAGPKRRVGSGKRRDSDGTTQARDGDGDAASGPCEGAPGSEAKVAAMVTRAALRLPLFRSDDASR